MQKIHPAVGVPNFGKPIQFGSLLLSPSSPSSISHLNNNSNTTFMYKPTGSSGFDSFPQWTSKSSTSTSSPSPSLSAYYSIPSPSSPATSPIPSYEISSPTPSTNNKKQKTSNNDKFLNNPYNDSEGSSIKNILNPVDNFSYQFDGHLLPSRSSSSSASSSLSSTPVTSSSSSMIIKDGTNSNRSILLSNSIAECCSPVSSPSSPIDHQLPNNASNKQLVFQWIQELANLKKRETFLLENLKNFTNSDVDSDDQMEIFQAPNSSSSSNKETVPQIENVKPVVQNQSIPINISQQPPELVVCHRYIHPSPVLSVDTDLLNRVSGQLVVQVSLVYNSTFKPVTTKQADGKQEVLQGVRVQEVDKNGVVVFNKLKVSEVSSKHLHQSFCFLFTLSEVHNAETTSEQSTVLTQLTSSSFHVLSRSNKRKKDDEVESDSQEPSSPIHSKSSPVCSSPSSPSSPYHNHVVFPTVSSAATSDENVTATTSPSPVSMNTVAHSPSSSSSSSSSSDPNYIDITELLVLPQKEAASRLGISESMLCKRFKECTRRKWPYRYLRKIDKVIKILTFQHGNDIPKEEKEKLDKLMQEREECLKPVKIRITGCLEKDDDSQSPSGTYNFKVVSAGASIASHRSSGSSSQLVPQTPTKSNSIQSIINFSKDEVEESTPPHQRVSSILPSSSQFSHNNGGSENAHNGLENILETLEMLKHTRQ
ncbi:hypothetical protein PPL_08007 [Heterostelium album PN500]|uniref:RWP-RK domain-containing protein n=1 Tax=Heterostelium pallidum (strain ATCC 26659 / Pp 5 / PN500) TaxID=670386 RepID=D3BHK4_HETP5|nr:hypothetical protein PPL_08007 [Heterostelium album PN500]EFA79181.1 hypothetical protein PPL_08007 [Heterostelium album PN500]|eukprot:XP_020431302.1 hypothetical protein PPL_08007 [Heterostelium album PN500]